MFCAPRLVFRRYQGRRVPVSRFARPNSFSAISGPQIPFSCCARQDSFSAVPRASLTVFMFSAPGHFFGETEGVRSRFHVFRSRTRFRRYRGRRVPFCCFARPDSFWRYRGRRVPFSCFALPDSFSAVPSASGPFFMFCAPGIVSGGTEGVGSRFHVLRSRTRLRWYRGPRVPFSYFARPDSFSAVLRASSPFSMSLAPRHIFGETEGVGSHFHVLRSRTRFRWYQGRRVPFSCFASLYTFLAPGHIFGGTEGVGSHFHVLRSQTSFQRYRGRRVPFSYFARPDLFSAVPRASDSIILFCAPGLVFDGTMGVGSRFLVLRARTRF
jgi:hypothetical protein